MLDDQNINSVTFTQQYDLRKFARHAGAGARSFPAALAIRLPHTVKLLDSTQGLVPSFRSIKLCLLCFIGTSRVTRANARLDFEHISMLFQILTGFPDQKFVHYFHLNMLYGMLVF